MGVHGLWQLLQPTGRPVTLESLEGKILAIDVSIWLHHMVKGMRDRYGNSIPNAHLVGLFKRICKLLHYRIKPVFVFDGGVPELKKQTMALRRERREEVNISSSKTAKKMLDIMLKHHAVSTVLGTGPQATLGEDSSSGIPANQTALLRAPTATDKGPDMFILPALPETDRPSELDAPNDSWEERMSLRDDVYTEFADLEGIDIDSEDFKCLPPEIQHEILTDIKDARKMNMWNNRRQLPAISSEFSSFQLGKLVKQSQLTRKILDVRKEMNLRESGDMAANLTPAQRVAGHIETSRIVSEDSTHYILIKDLRSIEEEEEEDTGDAAQEVEDIFKKKRLENELEREEKVKLRLEDGKVKDEIVDNHSFNVLNVQGNITDLKHEADQSVDLTGDVDNFHAKLKNDNFANERNRGDLSCADSHKMAVDLTNDSWSIPNDEILGDDPSCELDTQKHKIPPNAYRQRPMESVNLSSDDDDEDSVLDKTGITNENKRPNDLTAKSIINIEHNHTIGDKLDNVEAEVKDIFSDVVMTNFEFGKRSVTSDEGNNEQAKKLKLEAVKETTNVHLNDETGELSEEDDDFLEITIDPSTIAPDNELFPASVFTQETPGGDEEKKSQPDDLVEIDDLEDDEEKNAQISLDNEFKDMSKTELFELQESLQQQTAELQSTRQQQERVGVSITDQMYVEAQELVELFGLPYLISPMEAEAQCAQLDLTNQTHGTITDDSDIWLFGGRRVYKNFFNQNKDVEFYKDYDIKTQMLLDRKKMIDIALLCGSDYTDGIQGVGPVTAMEILGEFQGMDLSPLQSFRDWWDTAQTQVKVVQETKVKKTLRHLHVDEGFPSKAVKEAYLQPTVDESDDSFSWGKPDLDLLREYANSKFGWTRTRSDELLLPMMKQLNQTQTQQRITSFMISEPPESRKLKSKRVKRILTRMKCQNRESTNTTTEDDAATISANKSTNTVSTKGKSVRGMEAKNTKVSGIKMGGAMRSSEGGWVRPSVGAVPSSEHNVMFKDSVELDDGFGGSDSDDALLGDIDLDAIQRSSAQDVLKGQGQKRVQGDRGQDHSECQERGKIGCRQQGNNDSNHIKCRSKETGSNDVNSKNNDAHRRTRPGNVTKRSRGRGNKQTISHKEDNSSKMADISTSEHFHETSGSSGKSRPKKELSKVVRPNLLINRKSGGRKVQQTTRTVADVQLSESDSESD